MYYGQSARAGMSHRYDASLYGIVLMPSDRGSWNCWRPARFTPAAIRSRRPARRRARWRRRSGPLSAGAATGSVPATSPWTVSRRRGACRCSLRRRQRGGAVRVARAGAHLCRQDLVGVQRRCLQLYGQHARQPGLVCGRRAGAHAGRTRYRQQRHGSWPGYVPAGRSEPQRGRRLRGHGERQSVRACEPFGCVAGAGWPRHSPQQLHGRGPGRDGNIGRPQPVDGGQGQRGQPGARGAWRHARGAAVALQAGAGARGADYAGFLARYLGDKTADPARPLLDQGLPFKTTRPSCCCG